jgi:hypothetical protein
VWPHERSCETVLSGGPKSSSPDAFLHSFRRVSDLDDPARGGIGIGKGMTLDILHAAARSSLSAPRITIPGRVAGYKQKAARSMPSGLPGSKSIRAETPVKPRCGDPKQGRLRGAFTFKRSSKIFAGVLSRSLFVDQANIAEPLSVNRT